MERRSCSIRLELTVGLKLGSGVAALLLVKGGARLLILNSIELSRDDGECWPGQSEPTDVDDYPI